MEDHICTICNKPVIFGKQVHHGRSLNHYACEAPRMEELKKLTHDNAIASVDASIKKMEQAIAKLRKDYKS